MTTALAVCPRCGGNLRRVKNVSDSRGEGGDDSKVCAACGWETGQAIVRVAPPAVSGVFGRSHKTSHDAPGKDMSANKPKLRAVDVIGRSNGKASSIMRIQEGVGDVQQVSVKPISRNEQMDTQDAIDALTGLGYKAREAREAVELTSADLPIEERVRLALANVVSGRQNAYRPAQLTAPAVPAKRKRGGIRNEEHLLKLHAGRDRWTQDPDRKTGGRPENKVTRKCKMCPTVFTRKLSAMKDGRGKYCSRKCQMADPEYRTTLSRNMAYRHANGKIAADHATATKPEDRRKDLHSMIQKRPEQPAQLQDKRRFTGNGVAALSMEIFDAAINYQQATANFLRVIHKGLNAPPDVALDLTPSEMQLVDRRPLHQFAAPAAVHKKGGGRSRHVDSKPDGVPHRRSSSNVGSRTPALAGDPPRPTARHRTGPPVGPMTQILLDVLREAGKPLHKKEIHALAVKAGWQAAAGLKTAPVELIYASLKGNASVVRTAPGAFALK